MHVLFQVLARFDRDTLAFVLELLSELRHKKLQVLPVIISPPLSRCGAGTARGGLPTRFHPQYPATDRLGRIAHDNERGIVYTAFHAACSPADFPTFLLAARSLGPCPCRMLEQIYATN